MHISIFYKFFNISTTLLQRYQELFTFDVWDIASPLPPFIAPRSYKESVKRSKQDNLSSFEAKKHTLMLSRYRAICRIGNNIQALCPGL